MEIFSRRERLLPLYILLLSASVLCASCSRRLKLVPIEEVEPIFRDVLSDGGIQLTVSMYTKDTFYMTVRNTREGYILRSMPSITSDTGDILFPAMRNGNEIGFNYSPRGDKVNDGEKDICFNWVLDETGEGAFLILRKTVVIDVTRRHGKYCVRTFKVLPVTDSD